MNRTGFMTLVVLMALMALVSAAGNFVLNTPLGNQVIGSKMNITWIYPGKKSDTGDLLMVDRQSNDTATLQKNVKLSTQKFQWTVQSKPGTYYLALTSPQGIAYSGSLDVTTTNSTTTTTTTSANPSSNQPTSTDTSSLGETKSSTPSPATATKTASNAQSNASNSVAFSCSLFTTLLGMSVFITQLI